MFVRLELGTAVDVTYQDKTRHLYHFHFFSQNATYPLVLLSGKQLFSQDLLVKNSLGWHCSANCRNTTFIAITQLG